MNQRDELGTARSGGRGGWSFRLAVLLTVGAVAVFTAVFLLWGPEGTRPYTTTTPASPTADGIQTLYKLVFWMALVVFVGVQIGIVYTALKYRRTTTGADRPEQIHGNRRLEVLWTVIPAIVLLIILVPSITTMYDQDAAAQDEEGALIIDVYGKQWWWEVHYGTDGYGRELEVITANEVPIPVGQRVVFRLHSNNVIHSFWVPQLAGKMDVVPGHVNRMAVTAREPGDYYGECAELCGAQHAWMRFKIVAVPEEEFYTWVNAWRSGPGEQTAALTGDVSQVPPEFGLCITCHRVNGTNANAASQGIEAAQIFGPNLSLFACRETLAAGLLINNEENLRAWLSNPGGIKEENFMATQIGADTLDEATIDVLVNYLYSLQPAEGCPGGGAAGAVSAATPAATPRD